MIKHIVLMKPKPGTTETQMAELLCELAGLKDKFETILDFTGNKDISGGSRSHGFTHGFTMTFRDAEGLTAYLPHPDHQAIASKVRAQCDDVLVFDYEA